MKKLIFPFLILGFLLTSCENDDDVCVSGEATPRLKIKFKSADNKVLTLESLYLDVDYGNNNILTVVRAAKVDLPSPSTLKNSLPTIPVMAPFFWLGIR